MTQIFLSASVPIQGRGNFIESANPFLIQFAVRELLTVCLGRRRMVWGVCESLDVRYASAVRLYQSRFFEEWFPEENKSFQNVTFVPAVPSDRAESLKRMRDAMFAGPFEAAVFVGGMEGIFDEYRIFKKLHPKAKIIALSAPGGAAMQLAGKLKQKHDGIDFARLFHRKLSISATEPRDQVQSV